jgi:hypothetical protein
MDILMRKIRCLITEEAKKINKDEPIFKEKFFDLVNEIEANLANGEDWLKQEKEEGFTVSAAESEGYVKALRQVKGTYINFLKETEEENKKE